MDCSFDFCSTCKGAILKEEPKEIVANNSFKWILTGYILLKIVRI